jgi:hypothetical protein
MSQLETRVRPFLQPQALDPIEKRLYMQAERERLCSRAVIPWRTSIWLAASVDPAWFMSTKNRHLGAAAQRIPGASTTMAFGHVALQVLTIKVPETVGPQTRVTTDVRQGPWNELTVQVWPPRATIHWPPVMGLNGEDGLDALADRFCAAHYSGEVETIAV